MGNWRANRRNTSQGTRSTGSSPNWEPSQRLSRRPSLHNVARYAEALAEHKDREARLEEESDDNEIEERPDDLPDEVPTKATITIKEINDNRYYYWQWREEDKIKSKYKEPVNLDK